MTWQNGTSLFRNSLPGQGQAQRQQSSPAKEHSKQL